MNADIGAGQSAMVIGPLQPGGGLGGTNVMRVCVTRGRAAGRDGWVILPVCVEVEVDLRRRLDGGGLFKSGSDLATRGLGFGSEKSVSKHPKCRNSGYGLNPSSTGKGIDFSILKTLVPGIVN